ncbi:MAG: phosphatase PAP2 family protein [Alicyclobacillus herbarius]|uniref:phosphatase PAP2 family protein n=1 Tax=Alicyclobacillus herbarius TaxID=122960 RepID=UPI000419A713|nr:phosphatase PAP2 family protein [Alicyclobacillus herbarius]MCL6631531.1 phosphatase PAP2 family protein [Alicyclobacillus herbarius]
MAFARIQAYDDRLVWCIRRLWGKSLSLDGFMVTVARWTPFVMVGLIAATVVLAFTQPQFHAVLHGFSAIAAAAAARFINEPITRAFCRPRPFEQMSFFPLVSHERGGSYPSNHATGAFALAVSMLAVPGIGWILLVLAALLSVSRVYVGLHYPSDIVGGVLHGTAVALLISWYLGI